MHRSETLDRGNRRGTDKFKNRNDEAWLGIWSHADQIITPVLQKKAMYVYK